VPAECLGTGLEVPGHLSPAGQQLLMRALDGLTRSAQGRPFPQHPALKSWLLLGRAAWRHLGPLSVRRENGSWL